MKKALLTVLIGFCVLCGVMVAQSGLFTRGDDQPGVILLQQTTDTEPASAATTVEPQGEAPSEANAPEPNAVDSNNLSASGGPFARTVLGSADPNSGYKYELDLNSRGASIERATFSEFNDRNRENPKPLVFLSPVNLSTGPLMTMANRELLLIDRDLEFAFQNLSWKLLGTESDPNGAQHAEFEAAINNGAGKPVIKLLKTFRIEPDSYMMSCSLKIENLGKASERLRFNMGGPVGLEREAVRRDGREAVAGFQVDGKVMSVRRNISKLRKSDIKDHRLDTDTEGARFLWAASTNKYFAAIVVPQPVGGAEYADWLIDRLGQFYNPDGDAKRNTGDETIGLDLKMADVQLAAAGEDGSSRTYDFKLYLGPKDKQLFDKSPTYSKLGFVQTIDFMSCCCPASIIQPLSFGILALMNWMYGFIHNYGVVIIIFVFIMRLILHPITKRSQVQMSKFAKLAPKAEEIKKKYAGNKAEMQKQLMELYRTGGSAPFLGILPMFIQMPIWIALYSAIYASIDLRGAPFLPFWITDLSVPDQLITWHPITIPILGWKLAALNLLPILMGVAFYLQQKLMPSQAAQVSANPQSAQQQKMMMVMMPVLFPLMLYPAPSGLNLYIMASTFAGVIEQYFIRKHIRERDEMDNQGKVSVTSKTGGKVKKKKPKPFFKY